MTGPDRGPLPADLGDIGDLLRERRPTVSELELDEIKQSVMRRASREAPGVVGRTKGVLMKSRIALATILVLGIVMSGAGAGLAVSGLSSDDDAAEAQYLVPGGDQDEGDEIGGPDGDATATTETTEQVAIQGDGTLPLTGFLAIPLVISGLALLVTGLVIRRKARE